MYICSFAHKWLDDTLREVFQLNAQSKLSSSTRNPLSRFQPCYSFCQEIFLFL